MVFVSVETARRIEIAEVEQLLACAEGLAARRPGEAIVRQSLHGGAVTWAGDDSPMSKIVLVGRASSVRGDLDRAGACLDRVSGTAPVEVSTLADPEVFAELAERGYRLVAFEDVLGRPLEQASSGSTTSGSGASGVSITVERVAPEHLEEWARVMADGFAAVDEQGVEAHQQVEQQVLQSLLLDLSAAEGMRRYLARRDGVVAGAAGMRPTDGIAQLAGAATLAEHRRQGVQRTLLEHRLAEAAGEGCDLAVVTTQPGSTSQHNVMRLGFAKLYSRAVLTRAG